MSEKEAGKEIEQLREAIEHHNFLYYIRNKPVISDNQFDLLLQRLKNLEEHFPAFGSEASPTRKVGAPPLDQLKKKKHTAPKLSLNASLDEKEAGDFIETVRAEARGNHTEFVLEPKFDGLSVEVVYERGRFSYAATRGDGETGEDISENIKTVNSLPLRLHLNDHYPDLLALRGEIYMGKEDFQRLNKKRIEQNQEPFANARNAAAGIGRQLDPKKVADKLLDIFFYELLGDEGNRFSSHWEMLHEFSGWGFKTSPECRRTSKFDAIRKADDESLLEIQEVGPEIAESITYFFGTEYNLEMLDLLDNLGMNIQTATPVKSGKLKSRTFVLTGTLDQYTREEARDKIESLGGRTASSVSDRTDYLVIGENPGNKLAEARQREVAIIDEKRFLEMIHESQC